MPAATPLDRDPLLAEARLAAGALVEALAAARQQTSDWSDRPLAEALVRAALDRCLTRLAASHCWGEANRTASNVLWEVAGAWLETGWLQRRAREKPRGYAGDFELLARIDDQFTCDDPLGRVLDSYFQSQSAAQAVRNRHQWLRREIVTAIQERHGLPLHYVSVGSGPARDIRAALTDLSAAEREVTRVTLLDLDPAAVQFAERELTDLLPGENVHAIRENLFRLARVAGKAAVLSGADLISCPGLFDYLSDTDATALLTTFWSHLAPGGRLMIFNFAPHHPSQAYMEWIGNWYLTYRDQADLELLARQSGIPENCLTISSESTTTDLVLMAGKPFG